MSVDILGTNCDQCRSMVQCCFTSAETVRLIRTESPGRPSRLSHSSWTLVEFMYLVFSRMPGETVGDSGLCCCVCVTSFERWLTPLCVDPVVGWGRDQEISVNREIGLGSHSSMCCFSLLSCFSMAASLDIVFVFVFLTTIQRASYKVKQVALHWLVPHHLISVVLVLSLIHIWRCRRWP